LAIGLVTIAIGRMVSLGSVVGMISAPLFVLATGRHELPELTVATALALLALLRHRENLKRLANGTERRLGDGRGSPPT
ncbi:MAG: glycerol-3-phosphate acyltransferase, partial [Trueperaceae bacterium]